MKIYTKVNTQHPQARTVLRSMVEKGAKQIAYYKDHGILFETPTQPTVNIKV